MKPTKSKPARYQAELKLERDQVRRAREKDHLVRAARRMRAALAVAIRAMIDPWVPPAEEGTIERDRRARYAPQLQAIARHRSYVISLLAGEMAGAILPRAMLLRAVFASLATHCGEAKIHDDVEAVSRAVRADFCSLGFEADPDLVDELAAAWPNRKAGRRRGTARSKFKVLRDVLGRSPLKNFSANKLATEWKRFSEQRRHESRGK
jgi:hypothetical protein